MKFLKQKTDYFEIIQMTLKLGEYIHAAKSAE